MNIIKPQEGFQEKFLSSPADIVIGGSGAGVGKTFALLIEPLRHITKVKGFGGVIFRRTTPQIRNEGGLWDTSLQLYPHVNAEPKESSLEWKFNFGNKIKFSHLEYEKDKLNWQGSQIPFIGFDELTHFSEGQFFYLLSRNRSICGVKPYVRATCNPDPDSWVATIVQWYIDQITGFPIPERIGIVRYFIKKGSDYIWGDSKQEVIEKSWFFLEGLVNKNQKAEDFVKSFTFINGSVYDNKKLMQKDPGYVSNLVSQDEETKLRLLDGNWKYIKSENDVYDAVCFSAMFGSLKSSTTGTKYITADIAMNGSDKFVVGVWDGFELIDILIMAKSNGKQVLDGIKEFANKYAVPNNRITFDNDGVGAFLGGFIPAGLPFVNNSKCIGRDNYVNLKTQCYSISGVDVNSGKYSISDKVANTMYDNKMTVRQRFMYERKAIKKATMTTDSKIHLISKDEMKTMLGSQSPDLMDMFMLRSYFTLGQKV